MSQFKGTGTALITPMHEDETIDFDALIRVVEHNINGGVEFLVALGTTGESATLSSKEKDQVIRTIMETAGGRVPVVIGCGGNNTHQVCEQIAQYTRDYQPAGFLSVSPYYNKPSQQGIIRHYLKIAAATDLPIILYNVPGRTSSNMLPETVVELANRCENIVAIKEASGNLEQGMEIMRTKPADFTVLSGDDVLGIAQVAVGFQGVISVASNAFPHEFSTLVRHALAGELTEARALQFRLLPVMQRHFDEGNPAGVKASLFLQKICDPWVRLPLVAATENLIARIQAEMQHAKLGSYA